MKIALISSIMIIIISNKDKFFIQGNSVSFFRLAAIKTSPVTKKIEIRLIFIRTRKVAIHNRYERLQ